MLTGLSGFDRVLFLLKSLAYVVLIAAGLACFFGAPCKEGLLFEANRTFVLMPFIEVFMAFFFFVLIFLVMPKMPWERRDEAERKEMGNGIRGLSIKLAGLLALAAGGAFLINLVWRLYGVSLTDVNALLAFGLFVLALCRDYLNVVHMAGRKERVEHFFRRYKVSVIAVVVTVTIAAMGMGLNQVFTFVVIALWYGIDLFFDYDARAAAKWRWRERRLQSS